MYAKVFNQCTLNNSFLALRLLLSMRIKPRDNNPFFLIFFALLLFFVTGCSHAPKTERIIDGRRVEGRFISPSAYHHYLQAEIALSRKNEKQALYELRSALVFDEKSAFLHVQLAKILITQNKKKEALIEIHTALAIDEDCEEAKVLLKTIQP